MADTPASPGSILDSLRTVEFRLTLKGYNVDEVDEYLEKAAVEAEALHEQVRQMSERVRQASERIASLESERREPAPAAVAPVAAAAGAVTDDTVQRTLVVAQRVVDELKAEAEVEAAKTVSEAEERARVTVSEAEARARTLTSESEQRLREEVSRLETMRGKLATDVETMARHLEQERNRLRGALTEVLKWVDENVQPANSLMALHPRGSEGGRPAGAGPRPAEPAKPAEAAPGAAEAPPRPAPRPAAAAAAGAPAGGPGGGDEDSGGAQVLDLRGPVPGDRA
jgi:cell division initiation protein